MNIPDFTAGMAAPLLISTPPGKLALLVEQTGKRRRASAKKFPNAHAALDWCERERTTFIYLPAPDHSEN